MRRKWMIANYLTAIILAMVSWLGFLAWATLRLL